jgi:hypothetical protein
MQKVEGSSPFIRSRKFLQISRPSRLSGKQHRGAWQGSLSFRAQRRSKFASTSTRPMGHWSTGRREGPANQQNRSARGSLRARAVGRHESSCGIAPSASTEGHLWVTRAARNAARLASRQGERGASDGTRTREPPAAEPSPGLSRSIRRRRTRGIRRSLEPTLARQEVSPRRFCAVADLCARNEQLLLNRLAACDVKVPFVVRSGRFVPALLVLD